MNMNVNYRQNKAGQGHTQCNDTSEAMYGNAMGSAMGINACKATQWNITLGHMQYNVKQCKVGKVGKASKARRIYICTYKQHHKTRFVHNTRIK